MLIHCLLITLVTRSTYESPDDLLKRRPRLDPVALRADHIESVRYIELPFDGEKHDCAEVRMVSGATHWINAWNDDFNEVWERVLENSESRSVV